MWAQLVVGKLITYIRLVVGKLSLDNLGCKKADSIQFGCKLIVDKCDCMQAVCRQSWLQES